MKLNTIDSFKQMNKRPVHQQIGPKEDDLEAYFHLLSMDEFSEAQKILRDLSEKEAEPTADEKNDPELYIQFQKKIATKNGTLFCELVVMSVCDDKGELCYTRDDVPELLPLVNPRFMRNFIDAFLRSQGVEQKEIASIEAEFPKQSK